MSVYSSRVGLGRAVRRWRLFLIPEELNPPQVIEDLRAGLTDRRPQKWEPEGFMRALIDPYANAVHVGLLRGKTPRSPDAKARNKALREKVLQEGIASLAPSDRVYLLRDAKSMSALHHGMWHVSNSYFASESALARTHQASAMKDQTLPATDRSSNPEAHWQSI